MLSRSTTGTRFAATMTLLIQLVLVSVGPVVDARLELESHGSGNAELHVESADDPGCDPGHAHRVCLIQALHAMDPPPEAPAAAVRIALAKSRRPHASLTRPLSAAAISSLGARAPPVV